MFIPHISGSRLRRVLLKTLGAAAVLCGSVQASALAPAPVDSSYELVSEDGARLDMATPALPDLNAFTTTEARRLLDRYPRVKPQIEVRKMFKEPTLHNFTSGLRTSEWAKRQLSFPKAIFVKSGFATPEDIYEQLKGTGYVSRVSEGVFVIRLPLVVEHDALLLVNGDKTGKELRLSLERGSFLVNDGELFVFNSKVYGWSEEHNGPSLYKNPDEFRPFIVSWGGSGTYLVDSDFRSLGYHLSKSYGITYTQYTSGNKDQMERETPKGWVIGSRFEDIYYGFYCYEAEGLAIVRNTYVNNIVYGIDPHDRSKRLVIAENTVYGSKKKHGIIVSREVDDSWIFGNESYDNKLSGFVIDRSSKHNIIANNKSHHNGSDGYTVYESPDNLFWGNSAYMNGKHGFRARNSTNVKFYTNMAFENGGFGIYGHVKDLSGTERNMEMDPYSSEVSMLVNGGKLMANKRGPFSVDKPLSIEIYDVDLLFPSNSLGLRMDGIFNQHYEAFLNILVKDRQAVIIRPRQKTGG